MIQHVAALLLWLQLTAGFIRPSAFHPPTLARLPSATTPLATKEKVTTSPDSPRKEDEELQDRTEYLAKPESMTYSGLLTKEKDVALKLELDFNDAVAFAGRALDTVEDAALHFKRMIFPAGPTPTPLEDTPETPEAGKKRTGKPRIVVIGCGWGGHAMSKVLDHETYDIVFVSQRNFFIFTPMLAASAVGTVEVRSITEPIRMANPNVAFVSGKVRVSMSTRSHLFHHFCLCLEPVEVPLSSPRILLPAPQVTSIEPEKQAVNLEATGLDQKKDVTLSYDYLVYAAGVKAGTFGIPGVREHCEVLKELQHARSIRSKILRVLDDASLPGVSHAARDKMLKFLVIGSGPTGIEFTGELCDMLTSDVPRLYPQLMKHIRLEVLSASDTILPQFEEEMQRRAIRDLEALRINVRLKSAAKAIEPGEAILSDGRRVPFGICIWAGGTEPRPLTRQLIEAIPGQSQEAGAKAGQVTVDPWMRVKGSGGSILAIGDASKVEGQQLPSTGQVAAQQGAYVARLLNRGYDTSTPVPTIPSCRKRGEGKVGGAGDAGDAEPSYDILTQLGDLIRLRGDVEARPFHFLNLGVLAYIGGGQGLVAVRGGQKTSVLDAAGKVGFWMWRSTYLVKQVQDAIQGSFMNLRRSQDAVLPLLSSQTHHHDP
ncbi:unnamed protein product [Chrysoparadoxa australica]